MSTSSNELLGEMIINLCEWSIISHYVIYISIATYHVQDFTISNATNNGDINITCIFAIGSNATGCRVDLTNNDYQQNITVHKDLFNTTTVPDGTYDVTVYDVVGDSTAVAITTTVTIINVPVTTSTVSIDTPGKVVT